MSTRVAFIGTGLMGRPMAQHLCRTGFGVTVYNRTPPPPGEWEALGAAVAGSAAEAVQGADVVVTMLPNGAVVGEVLAPGACSST